jgi:predicted  nucleic acid-binding Zn ribbon protein
MGERFALREMGRHDSRLSQRGRAICGNIEELTGRPAYYHLHRYYGRSYRKEAERRCPECGGEWRLPETWHRLFDFRCDNCRLLSNMANQLSSR